MATDTQDTKTLQALLAPLQQIGNAAPGEPVKAEAWNTVVDTLVELVTSVHGTKPEASVPHHEHPDEVRAGWLVPELRSIVQGGPLSDPALAGKLGEVERAVGRLGTRADELDANLREIRERVHDVSTRDLTRQGDVTAVRRVVEGMDDARDEVLALRKSLASIDEKVGTAVELGSLLQVDGSQVDIAEIVDRISSLERVRDRLRTGANGDTLDAAALEERFAKLANEVVTNDQLDEALKTRPGTIPPETVEGLRTSLRAELLASTGSSIETLAGEIRGETSAALAGVDGRVATALSGLLPEVQSSLLGAVRPEIAAAIDEARKSVLGDVEQLMGELKGDLSGQISALADSIPALVAELGAPQPELFTKLESAVAELQAQVESLAGLEKQTASLAETIAQLLRDTAPLAAGFEELRAQTQSFSETVSKLEVELEAVRAPELEQVQALVKEALAGVQEEWLAIVDQKIAEAIKTGGDPQIADRLTVIETTLPDLVEASVQEQVTPIVDTRLTEFQETALPGLVDLQLKRIIQ
jgi:hypothetical protein